MSGENTKAVVDADFADGESSAVRGDTSRGASPLLPLPWFFHLVCDAFLDEPAAGEVRAANNELVAEYLWQPDAEYVVRAANNYADMLAALKHAVDIAENKRSGTWDDLLQYRAAIQRAEGKA
jgi:hypothetical protein